MLSSHAPVSARLAAGSHLRRLRRAEDLNAYPPYCDRDDVSRRSFSEGGRLGVVGLRLL